MKKILYVAGFILGYIWFVYAWYVVTGLLHFGSDITPREAFVNWLALLYLILPGVGIYMGRLLYLKQPLYFPLLYTVWILSWLFYPIAFVTSMFLYFKYF